MLTARHTCLAGAALKASGSSSANTIQIMQPPAKPRAVGRMACEEQKPGPSCHACLKSLNNCRGPPSLSLGKEDCISPHHHRATRHRAHSRFGCTTAAAGRAPRGQQQPWQQLVPKCCPMPAQHWARLLDQCTQAKAAHMPRPNKAPACPRTQVACLGSYSQNNNLPTCT